MLTILDVRMRAAKINEVHLSLIQIGSFEYVFVFVVALQPLHLLIVLQANQVGELSPAVEVVSMVVVPKQNVIYLDVQVDVPKFMEPFHTVYHLDTRLQNVNFSEI